MREDVDPFGGSEIAGTAADELETSRELAALGWLGDIDNGLFRQ